METATPGGGRYVHASLHTAKIFKQRRVCPRRSEAASVMENLMKVDPRALKTPKLFLKRANVPVYQLDEYRCCVYVAN